MQLKAKLFEIQRKWLLNAHRVRAAGGIQINPYQRVLELGYELCAAWFRLIHLKYLLHCVLVCIWGKLSRYNLIQKSEILSTSTRFIWPLSEILTLPQESFRKFAFLKISNYRGNCLSSQIIIFANDRSREKPAQHFSAARNYTRMYNTSPILMNKLYRP